MKYMGSKARIAKEISAIINEIIFKKEIKTYIEPFVGGANMIEHIVCDRRFGLDSNEYLISMWNALGKGWIPPNTMTKEEYVNIRDNKEKYRKELVAIAGFVATYNAKWFGGYAGVVKTKIGTIRNYYDESLRNILKQKERLNDVQFIHKKYQEMDLNKLNNCLIYCDPPYENSTQYRDEFNHSEFWQWIRKVSERNVVLISEYNAPEDFSLIWSKEITTTLDKSSRKKDIEKLFIHNSSVDKIHILFI